MAGFASYSEIDPAKIHYGTWNKNISVAGTAGYWYDDSMLTALSSAGVSPPPNLYADAPLEASVLLAKNGIRHWPSGDHSEHLLEIMMHSNQGSEGECTWMLMDYVMFYPFIDCDAVDQQDFTNTTTLPRFTDGDGVRAFLVSQAAGSSTGSYTISYTNQDGTSGRTSTGAVPIPAAAGQLLNNSDAAVANRHYPFIALQSGDTGIRSVESLTWDVAPGGFAALVLCKPIATFTTHQTGGTMEKSWAGRLPEIHGDAYLSFLRHTRGAPSGGRRFFALITTIRN